MKHEANEPQDTASLTAGEQEVKALGVFAKNNNVWLKPNDISEEMMFKRLWKLGMIEFNGSAVPHYKLTPRGLAVLAAARQPATAGDRPAVIKRHSGYLDGTILHIGRRKYDMRRIHKSSANRLRQLLNSEQTTTTTEFEDDWLTPTVYFQFYSKPVVIQTKVYEK